MPIRAQLLAEIQGVLGTALPASLTAASAHSDLFEAFGWTIVLRTATKEGAAITYKNRDGSTPTLFTFRTSPAYIYSTVNPTTYAEIAFLGCPVLDAHIGI